MPKGKVDFKTYRQAFEPFHLGDRNEQTSVADKYRNADALMKVAGEYLTDRGVDITKPFDPKEILKGWENRGIERERLEEVAKAFILSKWRAEQIRQEVGEERLGVLLNQQPSANQQVPVNQQPPANQERPVEQPVADKKVASEELGSKGWYNNVIKNGLSRSFGGNEITQSNPLDWERLRILKDGKLVPAMSKGHVGMPTELDLDLLQDAAEKGNLFIYRMGEVYPQNLIDGVWYSTDPAIRQEKRPEAKKMPEAPKEPPPFAGTLEEELKANGLPANAQRDALKGSRQAAYDWAVRNLNKKKENYEKQVQEQYQAELKKYESERDRLLQEHNAKLQTWKKRVDAYNNLSVEIKDAIRDEINQRRTEIIQNQEVQRAADIDRRGALEWYHNQFLANMTYPSSEEALQATDGIDWSRFRIWDGEKFTSPVPEGQVGAPSTEALESLRNAAENGNLFQYRAADKYPSKWTGESWISMDKRWIDSLKPVLDEPPKPKMTVSEPRLEAYMQNISNRKLAVRKFFSGIRISVYQNEQEEYERKLQDYQDHLTSYENAQKTYEREMEKYNEELQIRQNVYDQKLRTYEGMLEQYNTLTPEQIAAMERELPQREQEIKQRREQEKQRADQLTEKQRADQGRLRNTEKRIDNLEAQPKVERFVGGEGALGRNAYEIIAPNGYNLPADSAITPRDAAAIHIALAGSTQAAVNRGLPPLSVQHYGQMMDGILYGEPTAEELQYISASYNAAKDYIGAYAGGNPQPLAEAMSEGLRNLLNVSRGKVSMGPETAALAKVADRIFSVLDKDQALLDSCTLSKEEMEYARGLVDLGRSYERFLDSSVKLTQASTGARTFSKDELVASAVDLSLGKMMGNYLDMGSPQMREQMLQTLGKTTNGALNTARQIYINDKTVQGIATDPKMRQGTNLDEKARNIATGIHNSLGDDPKEKAQVKAEVRVEVKKQIDLNDPKVKADIAAKKQVRTKQLELARDLLASYIPAVKNEPVEGNKRIRDMYSDMVNAQKRLAEDGKLTPDNKPLSLDHIDVQLVALDRYKIREMLESENANLPENQKVAVDFATINKRYNALKEAWKELEPDHPGLLLLDISVLDREKELRQEKEAELRKIATERAEAADVYKRESGFEVDTGNSKFWSNKQVLDRLEQLKAAKAALGENGERLSLNDKQVVQKDYELRGINPLKTNNTIVYEEDLEPAQKKEYDERMQTVDYLLRMNTPFVYKNYRYSDKVDRAMAELKAARTKYEASVEGAERDLPLNDVRIGAMNALDRANGGQPITTKWNDGAVKVFGEQMKGAKPADVEKLAKEQLPQMSRPVQAEVQAAVNQPPQLVGPPA